MVLSSCEGSLKVCLDVPHAAAPGESFGKLERHALASSTVTIVRERNLRATNRPAEISLYAELRPIEWERAKSSTE